MSTKESQKKPSMLTGERRDFQRLHAVGRVLIKSSIDPEQVFSAKLVDASADGLNLCGELLGDISIQPGAKLDIVVELDGDDDAPFILQGVVVWAHPLEGEPESRCRMGIVLSEPSDSNDNHDWRGLFLA